MANYQEKGNRTLEQRSDGTETIGGLKALDDFFSFSDTNPGPPVTAITTDSARTFAQKQRSASYSSATINRSLAALRRMLAIAREDGKIQMVPVIRLLKEPKARKGFVTQKQFDALLAALPNASATADSVSVLVRLQTRRSVCYSVGTSQLSRATHPARSRSDEGR